MKVSIHILLTLVLIMVQVEGNIVGRRLAKAQPRFHHYHHERVVSEMRNGHRHHPSFRTAVHGKVHPASALTAARESASYHKGLIDGALRATGHGGHVKGHIVPPKVKMASTLAHHGRPHPHIHVHTHGAMRGM